MGRPTPAIARQAASTSRLHTGARAEQVRLIKLDFPLKAGPIKGTCIRHDVRFRVSFVDVGTSIRGLFAHLPCSVGMRIERLAELCDAADSRGCV